MSSASEGFQILAEIIRREQFHIFVLYTIVRWCWILFDYAYRLTHSGDSLIHGSKKEQEEAKQYAKSAQLVTVLWKKTSEKFTKCDLTSFMYKHEKFVHPEEIIRDDGASLYVITKTHSAFCVNRERDVYMPREFPFLFNSQYENSQQLCIVSNDTLIQMSEHLGDPKTTMTFMAMSARCGSTLLVQMFGLVPGVRIMSEPWSLFDAHDLMKKRQLSEAQYKQLLQAIVRLQLKPDQAGKLKHMVVKLAPFSTAQCPIFKELFPEAKFYFVTRNMQKTILSIYKLGAAVITLSGILLRAGGRMWITSSVIPYDSADWWNKHDRYLERWLKGEMSDEQALAFGVATIYETFLEQRHIYKDSIIFEDFIKDPEGTLRAMFSEIGISEEYIAGALKALERNSQNGLLGKLGNDGIQIPKNHIEGMRKILQEIGTAINMDTTPEQFKDIIKGVKKMQ